MLAGEGVAHLCTPSVSYLKAVKSAAKGLTISHPGCCRQALLKKRGAVFGCVSECKKCQWTQLLTNMAHLIFRNHKGRLHSSPEEDSSAAKAVKGCGIYHVVSLIG